MGQFFAKIVSGLLPRFRSFEPFFDENVFTISFGRITFNATLVLKTVEINRTAEITLVFYKPLLFYTVDSNIYEKISLRHFYRKVSTVTPIEMKQETV